MLVFLRRHIEHRRGRRRHHQQPTDSTCVPDHSAISTQCTTYFFLSISQQISWEQHLRNSVVTVSENIVQQSTPTSHVLT